MKVYLFLGTHPAFKDLLDYPPNGVQYLSNISSSQMNISTVYSLKKQIIRTMATKTYNIFNVPRLLFIKSYDADLIFSTRGIIPLNNKPWIVQIEHVSHFVNLDVRRITLPKVKKRIVKYLHGNYCKKILINSETAKKEFLRIFHNMDLNDKIVTYWPTIKSTPLMRANDTDRVRILFDGTYFHKAGDVVIECFERLNDDYNIQLEMISDIPIELKKYYENKYPNITLHHRNLDRSYVMNKIYMRNDIYLYPSQADRYCNTILNAMNAAIPIVCPDYYCFSEFVINGSNGYLVPSPVWDRLKKYPDIITTFNEELEIRETTRKEFVDDLCEKLKILIENPSNRKRMGYIGRESIESGKFSIRKRNERLLKIYNEALV